MTDPNTTPTTTENLFADFARAGIRLASDLLAHLPPEMHAKLVQAERGGAHVVLELGPLPAFEAARLVLVEREGGRTVLSALELAEPNLQ